jgi:PAS domain S-box-containing protein
LASDWFWETDANNLFTFITQRYFDLTETESDKVIGQSFDMLLKRVHPEDVKFFKEIHSKIRKRQNFRNVEFRLQLSNGQVSWFHICGRPFFDSEGVYVGYRGTGSDVTLQKSTELALKLSEQRFRDIAESASDWFWETDDQLNLVSISPGFCQRFAVTENALRGSSFFRLFHPHNDKGFDPELLLQLGLVEKRTFRDFEYSVPALDGSPIWLSFSGKAAFGVHKEYLGYRGAVKDISARKRIEEALKMHQHELERLVDEQTWEIRAAKEAADLSNQAKTDFLENLSDSLRSPVHAILAFTELYLEKKERPSDEKIYSYIQHIHDSGRKLLPLLNDLSDISRLELGSMDFHPQAYSIEKLAREAADELLAYSKGIENILLTVDSPKWDTTVECDPDRIKQVFHNLLSNAVKFSDGAIKISISFSKDKLSHYGLNGSKRMPAVTVNVQDCGVGIPESELDSIFDLFVMSSRTRKGFSGAGLGLPICREIIEAHHGKISAKNGTSCGVVMSFSLPVKHVSDA